MFMLASLFCLLVTPIVLTSKTKVPPYINQCEEKGPHLEQCLIESFHHIQPYLETGIKEINLPSIEPFKVDEVSLSLTSGPNGYKISLKNIDIYGASKFTAKKIKLSKNGEPFELELEIPQLRIEAKYSSSGVLIILPASGNGTFNANFDDLSAKIRGNVSTFYKESVKFLHVDKLNVQLEAKKVKMAIKNVFRNNVILTQAINLFLRENGQEVLKAMMPQLRQKFATLFQLLANQLLSNVPLQTFFVTRS